MEPQTKTGADRPLHRHITAAGAARMEAYQREHGQPATTATVVTAQEIIASHRAADAAEQTIAMKRRHGKSVLEELLPLLMGMVSIYQPWPPAQGVNPHENRPLFDRYLVLTIKCAEAVAPYQSPKAILIKTDRRPEDEPDLTKLTDEELQIWRRLMIKAQRGPTIDASA